MSEATLRMSPRPFRRGLLAGRWLRLLCACLAAGATSGCRPANVGTAWAEPRQAPPRGIFRDVAAESGISFQWGHGGRSPLNIIETLGHGCAFLDYDGDGRMDALLVGNDRIALYRNLGGGRFADVSRQVGLAAQGMFYGVAVGDYDNDGHPDLYITGYGKCVLYHNTGHGAFEDVTAKAGVGALGPYDVVTAAAFADLDGDGKLDLFAGRYVTFTPSTIHFCTYGGGLAGCGVKNYDPVSPRVYRNEGGGRFRDVTKEWGFSTLHGRCLGVAACGAEDGRSVMLYAANDEMPGDLMVKRGNRYANIGVSSGTAYNQEGLTQGGMGVDWGDFDNDGRPDLAVTTFQSEPKCLYHNDRPGLFTEMGGPMGIAANTTANVGWTCKFLDYDNDGWLDLLITNGHSQDNADKIERGRTYAQMMQLYHGEAGRLFRPANAEAGGAFARPIVGRGAAVGDYDNDGRLDVLIVDEEGPAQLLHNEDSAPGHWLGVRLVGVHCNRDAIGARVSVTAGGTTYVRDQAIGGGYLSAHDPRVHFGLGRAGRVERLVVHWPDGRSDTVKDVTADRYVEVTEGRGRTR